MDESGYDGTGNSRKKSRIIPDSINITVRQTGRKKTKKKVLIDQKQIVFFSQKYADCSKYKRDELLAKATDLISDSSKYDRTTHYGAVDYIRNIKFDKKTGKVIEPEEVRSLDVEKVREEEKYGGCYLIVTSEFDLSDDKVIDAYHGLWSMPLFGCIRKRTHKGREEKSAISGNTMIYSSKAIRIKKKIYSFYP